MVSYKTAIKSILRPRGCAFNTFPGGVHYIGLVIAILLCIIGFIGVVSAGKPAGIISYIVGSFMTTTLWVYLNYYLVEGCQAKNMLTTLKQRNHLRLIMEGKAESGSVASNLQSM